MDMRRGIELLREQNILPFDGLLKIVFANAEARTGDGTWRVLLDEALATAERTGYRAFDAELHRVRGETLLKHGYANPAPAEEAFHSAIAVAKQQGTRSFELRAALSLAELYQSTSRPVEAHAVLAPALEGFMPTPEMPEIAEAQALVAALEEMDEVNAEAARRRRMTQLHAAYGNAMILAHGYGARETSAAFERARDTATGEDGPIGFRPTMAFGGELRSRRTRMRACASFLGHVDARPNPPRRASQIACGGEPTMRG